MRTPLARTLIAAAAISIVGAGRAAAVPQTLNGIAVEERLGGAPVLADALPPGQRPGGNPARSTLIVQLLVEESDFRGPGRAAALDRLQGRLDLYGARGIPIILVLGRFPVSDDQVEPWRQSLRAIAERARGKVAAYEAGEIDAGALLDPARYEYLLSFFAVQVRSLDRAALIVPGPIPAGESAWLRRLYAAGAAPYADALAIAPSGQDGEMLRQSVDVVGSVVGQEDPTAFVVLGPVVVSGQPAAATEQLISAALRGVGTKVAVTSFRAEQPILLSALPAFERIADLFSGNVIPLDSSTVRFLRGGRDVSSQVHYRLLYSPTRSNTYLVYWSDAAGSPVEARVDMSMTAPAVRDALTGVTERLPLPARIANEASTLRLPLAAHPLVLDFNYGAAAYSATSETQESTLPPVGEIIARHQQVQTAQDAAVRNYIAHLRIEMHFRPSPADPAYNVVMENQLFFDGSSAEWAQSSFSLNGATWTSNPPAFPLLQPEKVLSLPLELRLNKDYEYRLDGVELVDGRESFVVRFDPVDRAEALYRGTVWIDRSSYVRLKVHAVETRASGVVAASEEEQRFAPVGDVNGLPIWLMTRLISRQTYLMAGRTILNERQLQLSDVRLNAADFENARAEARASNQVMYKDTDRGVRYFVKKGTSRVVSDTMTMSARALAMGADIDPSFDYPLPIAGLNILDFNFLHRDMQLALLFGGVIALGNIQKTSLWGGRFDASVDFFGLAVRSNDAVFDEQGERRGERVPTTPVSAGINLGYRISPRQKISGRYEARYDGYFRDPQTNAGFVGPSSTATTGEGGAYEYRRNGYSLMGSATAYRRHTWKPWGTGPGFDPATRTYARYDVGLSKDFVFATFHTVHLNGQYFGGRRLDRFSMYQFGLFDANRMHGVPASLKLEELAMFRGSYSFNLFDVYRLDLFVDHARGRDSGVGGAWRPVTGLGAGATFRGPRSTIMRFDVGRSFLPARYRGAGSTVVQIMVLKPL